jgi:hypothetical protein
MVITVTHLTRMRPPYICVAGLHNRTAVRPVISGQLHKKLLRSNGGLFAIGAIVDLGPVRHVGAAPEHEDHSFNPVLAKYVGKVEANAFWQALKGIAQPSVDSIFGDDLVTRGRWSCGVNPGRGAASLGCLQVYGTPRIFIRGLDPQPTRSGLRLVLTDPILGKLDLGITDVRFFEEDFITVKEEVVDSVQARIDRGVRLLLSVGLTRATVPADKPLHWLQVNNIHLEDDPTWNI